jgi:hypothetical protein
MPQPREADHISVRHRPALGHERVPALDRQPRLIRRVGRRQIALGEYVRCDQVGNPVSKQRSDGLCPEDIVPLVRTELMADVVNETGQLEPDVARSIQHELVGALQTVIELAEAIGALGRDGPESLEQRDQLAHRHSSSTGCLDGTRPSPPSMSSMSVNVRSACCDRQINIACA